MVVYSTTFATFPCNFYICEYCCPVILSLYSRTVDFVYLVQYTVCFQRHWTILLHNSIRIVFLLWGLWRLWLDHLRIYCNNGPSINYFINFIVFLISCVFLVLCFRLKLVVVSVKLIYNHKRNQNAGCVSKRGFTGIFLLWLNLVVVHKHC